MTTTDNTIRQCKHCNKFWWAVSRIGQCNKSGKIQFADDFCSYGLPTEEKITDN